MRTFKYHVITAVSSLEPAELDEKGRQILVKTNNFQTARKECIQWAAWDDIYVKVMDLDGDILFDCDGAEEADRRYPKTVEMDID